MNDLIQSLKTLISYAPRLVERGAIMDKNLDDLVIEPDQDGNEIKITSLTNNHELLLAVNKYLRNLALQPYSYVANKPEDQPNYTGNNISRIKLDPDIGNERYSRALGRGFKHIEYVLHKIADDPQVLKKYFTLITKLNKLTNADLDYTVPKCAEIMRRPLKEPTIEVDLMDSWLELQRMAHDGPGKTVKLDSEQSPSSQTESAKELLGDSGIDWPENGSLITLKGYTGEQFYKSFVDDLDKILGGETNLKVHKSFAWNPETTPSVLEIPVDKMLKNAAQVNTLLDKYLKIKKELFGGPQPPSVSSN